jgi:hypothetical protein
MYLATHVEIESFKGNAFREGVEILDWNGVPISRAVGMAGAQSPSGAGKLAARHAFGVFSLTARPLNVLPPPDEEWVIVGFRNRSGGKRHEVKAAWWGTSDRETDRIPHRGSIVTRGIQKHRKSVVVPTRANRFGRKRSPHPTESSDICAFSRLRIWLSMT